jgi:hypothetical protein
MSGHNSSQVRFGEVEAEIITLAQTTDVFVKKAIDYWTALKGARRFPAHSELSLRGMVAFISYVVIVRVLDGGADYQYRFVGDAQVRAFKSPINGLKVSQIEETAPYIGSLLRDAYDRTCASGEATATRGCVNFGQSEMMPHYQETALFPLGDDERTVDHLLSVGVHIPRHSLAMTPARIAGLGARLIDPEKIAS